MRKVKCQYCNQTSEKAEMTHVESSSGNKVVKKYYHKNCLEMKEYKKKALDKFYEYTGSLAMPSVVYVAFKKCIESGLTEKDIYDMMLYIEKTKSVLNYPMGICYYMDRFMKDKSEKEKIKKANEKVINAPIKIIPLHMKKVEKEKDDDYDISDLL